MGTVAVEHFTDPFSPWCWAAQPVLRRLRYEFDDVEWTVRMTVWLRAAPGNLHPATDGAEDEHRSEWAEAASRTGMPVADRLWADHVPSSRPACAAVAYVRETVPDRAGTVLRRLREVAFVEGRGVDEPAEIARIAGGVPDVEEATVRHALEDGRADEALDLDLERALTVAADLESLEVRGDVSVLDAATRLRSPPSVGQEATGGDAELEEGDQDGESEAPALIGPPALRVDAGTVRIVDPRLPFNRLATALGRSVPQTGIEIDDKYATSRMAMHIPREAAESLSSQDFGAAVSPYLARFGRAHLPEITAATGISRETCLAALNALVARGEAERSSPTEWRIVHEPGGPVGDA